MLAARRAWLMAGGSLPADVVVWPANDVHMRQQLQNGQTLTIIGDQHVGSIARHIAPLCRAAKVRLVVGEVSSDGQLLSDAAVAAKSSRTTLISWPHVPAGLGQLAIAARALGRSLAMIGGLDGPMNAADEAVPIFPTYRYAIDIGPDQRTPTAAGYSSWAGAIWRWVR